MKIAKVIGAFAMLALAVYTITLDHVGVSAFPIVLSGLILMEL